MRNLQRRTVNGLVERRGKVAKAETSTGNVEAFHYIAS